MVDTVVLRINRNDFAITPSAYPHFSQSVRSVLDAGVKTGRFVKVVYQPSQELKQSGLYFPRFSIMKAARRGGYTIYAHIEFSAPKILFGNNFDELTGNELWQVCEALSERLRMMEIIVRPETLASATVSTIHYGKNIPFTNYTTASQIIGDLAKCDATIRKQHNTRDYINGGEALYLQTSASGLIIYDKVRELKTTRWKKGQFEDDNQCQFYVLDQVKTPFEVVRIEVRLRKPETIRSTFSKCNIDLHSNKFCDLFSRDIAQSILMDYCSVFMAEQNKLIAIRGNLGELITELKRGSPKISPKNILTIIGMKALLNEDGFRNIRKEIGATSEQWLRIKETINKANISTSQQNSIDIVNQSLEKFIPIKLEDYIQDADNH